MASPPVSYDFGAFRLDVRERVLFNGTRPVPLTPKATETLLALVERHGRLVTKEELFRVVWPDAFVEENNLAQNISMLRRVLGEDAGGAQFIETVPKRGYRFVGAVVEQHERPAVAARSETEPALPSAPALPAAPPLARPPLPRAGLGHAAIWAVILALPVAVAIAGVWRDREQPADAVNPPAIATAMDERPHGSEPWRIAVLPFVNLGAPSDESFVAGMTEEITNRLAGLTGLAVPSSTTIGQYNRRGKPLRQLGADLDVEYVVEGSIRWAKEPGPARVRIASRLIRVADDTTIWTEQYDGRVDDLFAVQAQIAYRVAGALEVALDARERRLVAARPTSDMEAYVAYLRGIAEYPRGDSDTASLDSARAELESAVARDPRFALAWSALARTYAAQYRSADRRTPETKEAAYRAARTAIALDPGLAEGHLALAQALLFTDRDYEGARRELEVARVGRLKPAEAWRLVGVIERRMGRWRESLAAHMRVFEVDPAAAAEPISVHYLHFRQYDEARRFIGIARAADLAGAVVPDAWTRFSASGDVGAARPVLESALASQSPADARVLGLLARLEWFDGRYERALELVNAMGPSGGWLAPDFRFPAALAAGQIHESMGRDDAATKMFAKAAAELEARLRRTPDDYQVEGALAFATLGLGRREEAIRHAVRATELLPTGKDAAEGPLYLYLLAQVQSRAGRYDDAFATLDQMFSVPSFYNEHWVRRDPGFADLTKQPSFAAHFDRWATQHGDALLY